MKRLEDDLHAYYKSETTYCKFVTVMAVEVSSL